MNRFRVTLPRLGIAGLFALFVGGCAGLSGVSPPAAALMSLAALLVGGAVACSDISGEDDGWTVPEDADVSDVPDAADADELDSAEGTWQTCCRNGRIDTCFCPAGAVCNYGRFKRCGGNRCVAGFRGTCPGDAYDADDAGDANDADDASDTADAGDTVDTAEGTWQTCCQNGEVSTCYCPPRVACNYGRFKRCGGDSCVGPRQTCPADAGEL